MCVYSNWLLFEGIYSSPLEEHKRSNSEYEYNERWFSPIDRTLRRELKSRFGSEEFWFNTTEYKELIDLRIKHSTGYFKFLVPKDRVTSSSARIFALWITVPALIVILICGRECSSKRQKGKLVAWASRQRMLWRPAAVGFRSSGWSPASGFWACPG